MPTTQPLDEDYLSDTSEGPLNTIATVTAPAAPAPAAAPSSVKKAAATPAAQPTGRILHTPGLTLNRQDTPAKPAAPTAPSETPHANHYTPQDVIKAWEDYIDSHGTQHLLANAMRAVTPEPAGNDTFRLSQSAIHIKYITMHLDDILRAVRQQTGNANIRFELHEVATDSPLVWSDQEFLKHIIDDHPAIVDFIRDMNLKLF